MKHIAQRHGEGQGLVEFSFAIVIFLVLLMGVVDFGMAIYKYNGVSEAAREIARVASVHQGANFSSPEITAVEGTQRNLVPGLTVASRTCTDINGAAVAATAGKCPSSAFVTIVVTSEYKAATPLLGLLPAWTMKGSSSAQIQQ